jgi:hypothetical protein
MPARKSRWDFWGRVSKAGYNECWEWQGAKSASGHGRVMAEGKIWYTHRLAYEFSKGTLPAWSFDAEVQHSCNNPACCNPLHLWLGTRKDNMKTAGEQGKLSRKGCANGNSKLSDEAIKAIRSDPRTSRVIGADYGISHRQVLNIRNGINWSVT